jgi:hypothetical protein
VAISILQVLQWLLARAVSKYFLNRKMQHYEGSWQISRMEQM